MEKALIVRTDGQHEIVEFEIGNSYELIKNAVQGYIECVSIKHGDLWLNEEGKLLGLPINKFATDYFRSSYAGTDDFIVGDVIFTGGVDEEGETLGLSEEALEQYLEEIGHRS